VSPAAGAQGELFVDPAAQPSPAPAVPAAGGPKERASAAKSRLPMGPKPLDPSLPREVIAVPPPSPESLRCPVTQKLMQPGFEETLEVLARHPPKWFVKCYKRTVWVSPAKSAPVYAEWPADVLPRSRVHASVVAHLASAHYAEHLPFYRIEQQLARTGVDLPRNCQVALMKQLDQLVAPLVRAMQADVLGSDYLYLDATPMPLSDPARPGRDREATMWAYRNAEGTVWFDYQTSKSPQHPDRILKAANFRGYLHTDAAQGLGAIGPPDQVTSLGCFAHLRRYFFEADKCGERDAEPYLLAINQIFRVEQIARRFRLSPERRARLRARLSVPRFDALIVRAEQASLTTLPKSKLGEALHYLLAQRAPLRRCLTEARAEISTNAVERAIRPLKLGAKNWLHIGHPSAGPRLANLFSVVENCRQLGLDPETYLIDLITRLPSHPAKQISELLPRAWAQTHRAAAPTPAATSPAPASGADQSR
jgi:transposase